MKGNDYSSMEKGEIRPDNAEKQMIVMIPTRDDCNPSSTANGAADDKTENVDNCPAGYPRLAALLDSDENFLLYRRFGYLQARLLLHKQDQLRELEVELNDWDKIDEVRAPRWLRSREMGDVKNTKRKELLEHIEKMFLEYSQLLTTAHDLASFNRPPTRDYWSLRKYFDEQAPIVDEESYIYHKEDIVALKPGREHSWLDTFVEKILHRMNCRLVRELRAKTNPESSGVILYHRERIEIIVSLIITIIIVAILITPIYIFFYLTVGAQNNHSIAIIISVLLIFTLLFSGVLSLFTRAKRHEILAAAAAYCAVLVVFIGNVGKLNT
ncbi:hypothetical protein LARI1_G001244 [Lachnellula arida]|uniref:DUF6594 domain-containing protein n=1 Tax=Lachnellula arida TaxID=1316785 RepID=A0A8T9BLT2_9HELO|nr:hypothetical protein LARI1_G001244 [Lachnellula arida]